MDTISLLNDLKIVKESYTETNPNRTMVYNVYPSDRLPRHLNTNHTNNYFIIANDSKASSKGTHWLAFFVGNKNGKRVIEYFDSYGFSPWQNKYFKRFIKNNCDKITYNKKMLQSVFSTKCGMYCLAFFVS